MPSTKQSYQPTIGLEIHVQLKTASKMFCSCRNASWQPDYDQLKPNSHICPVCTGQPGALPVINQQAVDFVVKAGLALNCRIARHSKFDRKNYFYPDLPKGYQISQYDQPLCEKGYLELNGDKIGITRIHLEEDTGKLIHPAGEAYSLVDYNRAGVPLMEMVTEPDIHSAATAKEFARALQKIFRTLNISDADMEKSQMRCEVNISLSAEKGKLGTKVEIKNLNSFKAVERSIEYEIMRQSKLLDQGEEIKQETRGWNEKEQRTYPQRLKETAHDYRYFPEPDLPPLKLEQTHIDKIKAELPELPLAKAERFQREYGLSASTAKLLTAQSALADYTENVISELYRWLADVGENPEDETALSQARQKITKLCTNWLVNKLNGILLKEKITFAEMKITPENFAELITLLFQNKINKQTALQLLEKMVAEGGDPSQILEEQGLGLIEDVGDLEPLVDKVIAAHPQQVAEFKKGKTVVLKYLIGQVMKESRGQANPQMAEELLIQKLT